MNSTADPTWLRVSFLRRLSVAAYTHCNVLQKGRKGLKIRDQGSSSDPAQCDRLDLRFGRFFLRPILEYDMATFTRSQRLLVSAGAAALGGAALMMLLAGNIVTLAGARATPVDLSPPFFGPDFPVCLP